MPWHSRFRWCPATKHSVPLQTEHFPAKSQCHTPSQNKQAKERACRAEKQRFLRGRLFLFLGFLRAAILPFRKAGCFSGKRSYCADGSSSKSTAARKIMRASDVVISPLLSTSQFAIIHSAGTSSCTATRSTSRASAVVIFPS